MELTGQCKQDFDKWLYTVYFKEYYQYQMIWQLMSESARNGVYLDWFDSVNIYVSQEVYGSPEFKIKYESSVNVKSEYWWLEGSILNPISESRNEATAEALTRANEIYNTKNETHEH